MLRVLLLMATLFCTPASAAEAPVPITVSLSMERTNLVVREPLKMSVELRNISDYPVHVVSISDANPSNQMEFSLVEIRSANNRREFRMGVDGETNCAGPRGPEYAGDLLPPGGALRFNIYPNLTFRYDPLTGSTGETGPTFDKPGKYTVRVAYCIPSGVVLLPPGPGQMILSNAIDVVVRKASRGDKEILDVLLKGAFTTFGEYDHSTSNVPELIKLIERYPDSAMIPHAKLAIARTRALHPDEARQLCAEVQKDYPGFRDEEIHYLLAFTALNQADYQSAKSIMEELIKRRPEMQNDHMVAHMYLWGKTAGPDGIGHWLEDRRVGKTVDLLAVQ